MYEYKAKVIRAIDGDTLEVEVDLGFSVFVRERVRLLDVNTPEISGVLKESEEYIRGMEAKVFVQNWLTLCENEVVLRTEKSKIGTDKYGRYLARVIANAGSTKGEILNEKLKSAGFTL